ncbi:MAG: hypothetical protein U0804_11815 [Gemmataceae bacterium]
MTRFAALAPLALALGCGGPPPAPTEPAKPAPPPPPVPVVVPAPPPAPPVAAPTPKSKAPAPFPGVARVAPKAKIPLPGKFEESAYGNSLQLSADGKRVAFGVRNADGQSWTQVWDLSGPPRALATLPKGSPAGLRVLAPSGRRVVTAEALVFDVDTGKQVCRLPDSFFSHGYFRDDDTLVFTQRSHGFDKAEKKPVRVWNVATNADAGSFDVPDDRFQTAAPTRGGAEFWLMMAAGKFEVECYDVATRKLVRTLRPEPADPARPFTSAGTNTAVAPDGAVFTSRTDRQRFYDGTTGKDVGSLPAGGGLGGQDGGLVFHGPRYLARNFALADNQKDTRPEVVVWDWRAGKARAVLTGLAETPGAAALAAFSPDGRTVAAAYRESAEVWVYDVGSTAD